MEIAILLSTLGLLRGGLETKAACLGERLVRRGHRVTLVAPRWLSAGRLAPDLKSLPVDWVRVLCPSVEGLRWRLGRPCSIERLGAGFYRGCLVHPGARALMARADATFSLLTTDTAYFSAWRLRLRRGHVSYTSGGGRKWLARDVSTVRLVNPLAAHTSPSIAQFPMDFELPPGIPDELLEIPYAVRPRSDRLLYVGRLESNKGVSELLDLFCGLAAEIPDLTLRFVGDGPLRRGLQQKVAEAGLACRVSFAGEVKLDRVWEEMRAADLLIHPSSCESFPFTLLEAQAVGLPFVSTDIPGIRGAVPESSRLLPFEAWDLWAAAVKDLVTDREERLRLSVLGRTWARDYTWDRPVEVLEESLRLAAERATVGRKVDA